MPLGCEKYGKFADPPAAPAATPDAYESVFSITASGLRLTDADGTAVAPDYTDSAYDSVTWATGTATWTPAGATAADGPVASWILSSGGGLGLSLDWGARWVSEVLLTIVAGTGTSPGLLIGLCDDDGMGAPNLATFVGYGLRQTTGTTMKPMSVVGAGAPAAATGSSGPYFLSPNVHHGTSIPAGYCYVHDATTGEEAKEVTAGVGSLANDVHLVVILQSTSGAVVSLSIGGVVVLSTAAI